MFPPSNIQPFPFNIISEVPGFIVKLVLSLIIQLLTVIIDAPKFKVRVLDEEDLN